MVCLAVVKNTSSGMCLYRSDRDWWIVKPEGFYSGALYLGKVYFPKDFIGKRVRFKVEVIE